MVKARPGSLSRIERGYPASPRLAERLAKAQEWQTLAEKRQAALDELKPYKDTADRYKGALAAILQQRSVPRGPVGGGAGPQACRARQLPSPPAPLGAPAPPRRCQRAIGVPGSRNLARRGGALQVGRGVNAEGSLPAWVLGTWVPGCLGHRSDTTGVSSSCGGCMREPPLSCLLPLEAHTNHA
jgi:hypothetical protein